MSGRHRMDRPLRNAVVDRRPLRATGHLHSALVELVDTGQRPACLDQSDVWLSESRTDRAIAVRLCAGCGVIVECAAAASEVHAHFGVWAARDRTTSSQWGAEKAFDQP
jgi:hypothetical protein